MDEACMQAQLAWFLDQGGSLPGAAVQWPAGRPTIVAPRNLAAGELVMRVPRALLLDAAHARQSPGCQALSALTDLPDHAILAVYLAHTRRRGGDWRPMVDAVPRRFDHLPMLFDRADWDLLAGTQSQGIARSYWRRLLENYKRVDAVLPREWRVRLRDFAWGWQLSSAFSFNLSLREGDAPSNTLAPLGELFGHDFERNCRFGGDAREGFEVFAMRAIPQGTPLTFSYGRLGNARMFAQYGLVIDGNPYDEVPLWFDLPADHWIHAWAPGLTEGRTQLRFEASRDLHAAGMQRLLSFLRLRVLGSAEAARAHPKIDARLPECIPALDPSLESAALGWLVEGCERAQKDYSCSLQEDDRLLAGDTLGPRQRAAVRARRAEKLLLAQVREFARDAIVTLQLPAKAREAGLHERARTDTDHGVWRHLREHLGLSRADRSVPEAESPMTEEERTLARWFHDQGGVIRGAELRRFGGLRGMVATRDIAKGEVVMEVPRHMYLTADSARHSPIGMALRAAGFDSVHSTLGAYLAESRRRGGFWHAMAAATPASFDERADAFGREAWRLLEGTRTQISAKANWKLIRDDFRRVRKALPRAAGLSLRDYRWGFHASATRTFTLQLDGRADIGLVPMAEMFNHAVDFNLNWGGDHSERFRIVALRDIPAGTQLTITYGRCCNSRLLAQYGFALEDNPHNTGQVTVSLPEGHWLQVEGRELTRGRDFSQFCIGEGLDSEEGRRMLAMLRLMMLPDAATAWATPGVERGKLADTSPLGLANERAALHVLLAAVQPSLEGIAGGSAEDDDALLAAGGLGPRERDAVVARRGEKRRLQALLVQARSALVTLYLPPAERAAALQRRLQEKSPWNGYFKLLLDTLGTAVEAGEQSTPA